MMNPEDQIRTELHNHRLPTALATPANLSDIVLAAVNRQRRNRMVIGAGATVIAVAIAVPLVPMALPAAPGGHSPTGGSASCPGDPYTGRAVVVVPAKPSDGAELEFPTPGGGPQAIHVYRTTEEATYLLDLKAGRYHELPYRLSLSPDGTQVAIDANGRLGVADRDAILREGESAITWPDVPIGNGPFWSPDGAAVLFTSISKRSGNIAYSAYRYDVATGAVTVTPISVKLIGATVGWAADSKRYLALLSRGSTDHGVVPGGLRYINSGGGLGPGIDVASGLVGGAEAYSPSRRYLIVDSWGLMTEEPTCSSIVDTETGAVVNVLASGARPIGWYDNKRFVQLNPDRTTLQIVDLASGEIAKQIDLTNLPVPWSVQIGASAGLTGAAAKFGF